MLLALFAAPADAQQVYGAGARPKQPAANPVPVRTARPVAAVQPAGLRENPPAVIGVPEVPAVPQPVVPPLPFESAIPPAPAVALPKVPAEAAANPVPPRVIPLPDSLPITPKLGPEVTRLPPRRDIFEIDNDSALETKIYESIASQLKPRKTPAELKASTPFPPLRPLVPPGTPYVAKTVHLEPGQVVYEPGFVVHNRLQFEERNSERYGWDLGLAQPFVSTLSFYKNVLLWPHNAASSLVTGRMDTNMGKCLPGSPTPYYLYPQGLTITGGVAEGIVVTGLAFIIP